MTPERQGFFDADRRVPTGCRRVSLLLSGEVQFLKPIKATVNRNKKPTLLSTSSVHTLVKGY
jgi:hypothetical protein